MQDQVIRACRLRRSTRACDMKGNSLWNDRKVKWITRWVSRYLAAFSFEASAGAALTLGFTTSIDMEAFHARISCRPCIAWSLCFAFLAASRVFASKYRMARLQVRNSRLSSTRLPCCALISVGLLCSGDLGFISVGKRLRHFWLCRVLWHACGGIISRPSPFEFERQRLLPDVLGITGTSANGTFSSELLVQWHEPSATVDCHHEHA